MRKLITLIIFLLFFIFISTSEAQVVIAEFKAANTDVRPVAERFRNHLHSSLRDYFAIMVRDETDLNQIRKEISKGVDKTWFQGTISPRFQQGIYILTGEVERSKESNKIDLTVKVFFTEAAKNPETFSLQGVSTKDLSKIARHISKSLQHSLPIYFDAHLREDILHIPYGRDRGAKIIETMEVYQIINGGIDYVAKAKIKRISNESSHAKITQYFFSDSSIDEKDLIIQRITKPRKSQRHKRKIERFQLPDFNNWFIFTASSIEFHNNDLSKFFGNPDLFQAQPIFVGAQINLGKTNTRMFFKGKGSIPYKTSLMINNEETSMNTSILSAGIGLHNQFPIINHFFPGFSVGVNYLNLQSKEELAGEINKVVYNGVNIEANLNMTIKIGKIGFYAETGYHYIPWLEAKSIKTISSTALSICAGITAYF